VVIGAYNAAPWIGQTLESVLAQTFPASEVIVVDDGSTDATPAIVQSYSGKVRLLTQEHRGRPHRNRGIRESSGDLVAFVDADDYWHPAKLARQIARLREREATWAICDSHWLDSATGRIRLPVGTPVQEGDILEALLLNNFIVASTPVVRRRILDEVGLFDETPEVAPVEDWDLWLRIAAGYPVACVRERLVTLRLHDDSFLAATPLDRRVESIENVIGRAVRREPERLDRLKRPALFNAYHAAGVRAFRTHEFPSAREFFVKALRQQPARLEDLGYLMLSCLRAKTPRAVSGVAQKRGGGK
jgi:glycosyltransferase involved in cell wall biosynthesis